MMENIDREEFHIIELSFVLPCYSHKPQCFIKVLCKTNNVLVFVDPWSCMSSGVYLANLHIKTLTALPILAKVAQYESIEQICKHLFTDCQLNLDPDFQQF